MGMSPAELLARLPWSVIAVWRRRCTADFMAKAKLRIHALQEMMHPEHGGTSRGHVW